LSVKYPDNEKKSTRSEFIFCYSGQSCIFAEKKESGMAVISMFYGLIISMFYGDGKQHHLPHIHVKYQGDEAVFSIPDGELIDGSLPSEKVPFKIKSA
jgi:hypothetical protein